MLETENKQFDMNNIQKNRRLLENYNRLRTQYVNDLNMGKVYAFRNSLLNDLLLNLFSLLEV